MSVATYGLIEARAGYIKVGLDDVYDVEIRLEFNEDAILKFVLTPAEAVRLANAILSLGSADPDSTEQK